MKIKSPLFPIVLSLAFLAVPAPDTQAQVGPVAVKIKKVDVNEQTSPKYNTALVTEKRVSRNKKWLEIEVEFQAAKTRDDGIPFIDDLLFKYYVVFKHLDPVTKKPVMATGQLTHINIEPKEDSHSVMYISPATVSRIRGRVGDANATTDVQAVAVQVIYQGQEVAVEATAGESAKWWQTGIYPPKDGLMLKKSDTPFAPLWYEYHAEVKADR